MAYEDESSVHELTLRDLEEQLAINEAYVVELALAKLRLRQIAIFWFCVAVTSSLALFVSALPLFQRMTAVGWLIPETVIGHAILTTLLTAMLFVMGLSLSRYLLISPLLVEANELKRANTDAIFEARRLLREPF